MFLMLFGRSTWWHSSTWVGEGFYYNLIGNTRSINLYAFNSAPLELASALSSLLTCPPNYSSQSIAWA